MTTLEGFLTFLGINKAAAISGAVGGLLSLRFVPECNWFYRMNTVLCAGAAANFLTAPIYQTFAVKGMNEAGVGFVVGLFSMTLLAMLFKTLQELELTKMVTGFITRHTGGGEKK